jgi:putative membrane protein
MNTNPYIPSRLQRMIVTSLCSLALPAAIMAQTTVREERVVAPARDVRVVEPARPLKRGDKDFFEKAAKTSMTEIAISRVAAARTSNAEVRRFAQVMVDDHESALEQLSALAGARGFLLPAKDPYPEKWEKRDAKDFDKDYLEKMIDDHEHAVKSFEKQAKDGDDADAVAYARKHLPKLQQHLQHALDLKRALTAKPDRR